ncbi:MAG TPA: hypothetical protein VK668_13525 [Mucilaginibacter sp.]|nr:hypothetical protein [Mucilaginibacter sp.]
MFSNVNAQSSADNRESARVFVQKFYDWYTVLYSNQLGKKDSLPTNVVAINQRQEYFDIPLRKALINDYRAQSKITEGIVGLNWDPFLTGQEIRIGYQTGNVKQVGNKFLVDIHDIEKGKLESAILDAELLLVAEVVKVNGHWVFMNFIYPKRHDNLLMVLRSLRKDRDETTK